MLYARQQQARSVNISPPGEFGTDFSHTDDLSSNFLYFLNNFLHSYLVTDAVLWIQVRYSYFLLSFAIFQKLLFTFLSLYTFTVFFPFA